MDPDTLAGDNQAQLDDSPTAPLSPNSTAPNLQLTLDEQSDGSDAGSPPRKCSKDVDVTEDGGPFLDVENDGVASNRTNNKLAPRGIHTTLTQSDTRKKARPLTELLTEGNINDSYRDAPTLRAGQSHEDRPLEDGSVYDFDDSDDRDGYPNNADTTMNEGSLSLESTMMSRSTPIGKRSNPTSFSPLTSFSQMTPRQGAPQRTPQTTTQVRSLTIASAFGRSRRLSTESGSSRASSSDATVVPPWVINARKAMNQSNELEDSIDSPGEADKSVYDPLEETDIMNHFLGQYSLDLLQLSLTEKKFWDRDIDNFMVNQLVNEVLVNPKFLYNSNPIPVILCITKVEYDKYLHCRRKCDEYGTSMDSFDKYFTGRLHVAGGKVRFKAVMFVNTAYPDHFPSLAEKYNASFTMQLCNVYIHDKNDPKNTLPQELIIKLAASSNLENPGSCTLLIPHQLNVARKLFFASRKLVIPSDPHLVELPVINPGANFVEWRHSVWNALKGSKALYSKGRGQIEPVLQFSKRSVAVMKRFFEFDEFIRRKISELPGWQYSRPVLFSSYHIGREGLNNLEDAEVIEVIDRCEAVLTNDQYAWDTPNSIKRGLGVDCGLVYFSKLLKARRALVRYLLGAFDFPSLRNLQVAFPGQFSHSKLEQFCVLPGTGKRFPPDDRHLCRAPKLPIVISDYSGTNLPFRWSFFAKEVKQLNSNVNRPLFEGNDSKFAFYSDNERENGADLSSVLFYTESLSSLSRQSVEHRIDGHSIAFSGFDACFTEVTENDVDTLFERIDVLITQTICVRQPTHFNFLFVGNHHKLTKLAAYLESRKPTITKVQEVNHYLVQPESEPNAAAAVDFELVNCLHTYLLAHYSATGSLCSLNLDARDRQMGAFIMKTSAYKCIKRILSWIIPEDGWLICFGMNLDVVQAATARGRNVLVCSGDATEDAIGEFTVAYGQWRSDIIYQMTCRSSEDSAQSLTDTRPNEEDAVFQRPIAPAPSRGRTRRGRGRGPGRGPGLGRGRGSRHRVNSNP